jgi:hypothetical protein
MRKPYEMNELYVNINALSTLVCAFLLHQSGISSRKKDFLHNLANSQRPGP